MVAIVDPEVTRLKFARELDLWKENVEAYRRRGWILLGDDDLTVDIGFLGRLPLGGPPLPAMTACVRVDFTNYDLWPPSVEFINPFTGEYAPPPVQALVDSDLGPQDIVVHNDPETNRPFFCVPGIRQYHDHPQHSGDAWLLHRDTHQGSLATICDRIWRSMARNVLGIHLEFQTLPGQIQMHLRIQNAPGEVAPLMWEQARQAERERAGQARPVLPQGQEPLPEALAAVGPAQAQGASGAHGEAR